MLLNSICSLLADKYRGVPVYIEDVPEGFQRPSFLVTLATEGTNLLNKNVYRDTPIYQIVYFGRLNASEQVYSERLYKVKEGSFFIARSYPGDLRERITGKTALR